MTKRITIFILLSVLCLSLYCPTTLALETETPASIDNSESVVKQPPQNTNTCKAGEDEMCLNVPIGNIKTMSLSNILADYIIMWYNFIIGAIGILATVMIMYGGLKWLTSRGNSAVIGDAKEKISSALIGLVLVFLSYTILYLVNPNLTIIKMPKFPDVSDVDYRTTNNGSGYEWSEPYLEYAEYVEPAVDLLAGLLTDRDQQTVLRFLEEQHNITIPRLDLDEVDAEELNTLIDFGGYYHNNHQNDLILTYVDDNTYFVPDDDFMVQLLNDNPPLLPPTTSGNSIMGIETIYNTTFEHTSRSGTISHPVTIIRTESGRGETATEVWTIRFN